MATQERAKLVAIVDDDELVRDALEDLITVVGLTARAFASGQEFLDSGQKNQTACLIADIRMPGLSGLDLQARLKSEQRDIPIIFVTAHGDATLRLQALREGAVEFLQKPFDNDVLLQHVRAALQK